MGRRNKKSNKSKRRNNDYRQMVSLRQPIAFSALVKHRYSSYCGINPLAGVLGTHVVSANGMFLVDTTGMPAPIPHQPMMFDQYCGFYDHYCVLGSKITVTPVNQNSIVLIGGVSLKDNAVVSSTDIDYMKEQGATTWKTFGNATRTGGKSYTKGFSAKRFFSKADVRDAAELKGTAVANPLEQAYYHIKVGASDRSSDPITMTMNYTIEYITLWSEPKNIAQS